jgi:hypothetical protein
MSVDAVQVASTGPVTTAIAANLGGLGAAAHTLPQ